MRSFLLVLFAALVGLFEGPAQIVCVVVLVAIAASDRGALRPGVVDLALLGWVFAGVPGTLDAESRISSEGALRPLLALAFLVGRAGFGRAEDATLKRAAIALCAALVLNGAYGLMQVFWFDPPLERFLAGRARSAHLIDPQHPERLRMATGLYYNRLKLAHTGAPVLGLFGLLALSTREKKHKIWLLAGATILALALFVTYRRAAPAALLAATLVLAAVMGRARLIWIGGAFGAAILALYGLTGAGRDRAAEAGEAWEERLQIFRAALDLLRDHPLLGVGHGDYKAAIAPYAQNIPEVLWTSPHNALLHVLAETGAVGLLCFVGAFVLALKSLIFRVRRDRALATPIVLADRFSLLGLSALAILGLFHSVLYHAPVALMFWTLLGVAARADSAVAQGSKAC